jgi:hypothetical protein
MLGMLRASETVALRATDTWIEFLDEGAPVLFIFVLNSKTDQLSHGHTIVLDSGSIRDLDVLQWHTLYMRQKHLAGKSSKWLFPNFSEVKNHLSAATPNKVIKRCLSMVGINPKPYGSHSARRGGATAAAKAGIEERLLRKHGYWRSDAVYCYIIESMQNRLSVSRAILKQK